MAGGRIPLAAFGVLLGHRLVQTKPGAAGEEGAVTQRHRRATRARAAAECCGWQRGAERTTRVAPLATEDGGAAARGHYTRLRNNLEPGPAWARVAMSSSNTRVRT